MKQNRPRRARNDLVGAACALTWPGTYEICREIVGESVGTPTWRPTRAGAARAMANQQTVYMTLDELVAWRHRTTRAMGLPARERNRLADRLGISVNKLVGLQGGRPIPKVVALACAHIDLGLSPPTDAMDVWFNARFIGIKPVADWLDVGANWLGDMLRGYSLRGAERTPVEPNLTVILALDWTWRIGPVNPFGDRIPLSVAGDLAPQP